jgi:hypothetical protein
MQKGMGDRNAVSSRAAMKNMMSFVLVSFAFILTSPIKIDDTAPVFSLWAVKLRLDGLLSP